MNSPKTGRKQAIVSSKFGKGKDPALGKKTQFKPGVSGNPAGKPKGAKHISTWIQELMEDETFQAKYMEGYEYKELSGVPIKALVRVAAIKALQGDKQWADWIAKYGWSQKIETDITSGGDKLGVGLSADQAEQLIRARANRSDI